MDSIKSLYDTNITFYIRKCSGVDDIFIELRTKKEGGRGEERKCIRWKRKAKKEIGEFMKCYNVPLLDILLAKCILMLLLLALTFHWTGLIRKMFYTC